MPAPVEREPYTYAADVEEYQQGGAADAPTHTPRSKRPMLKPLTITSGKMLDDLMAGPENVAIDFYKKDCGYCKALSKHWNRLARQIHSTNNEPGVVPIIVAKMDGVKYGAQIEALRPGWSEGRGYPTLLFKRADPNDGSDPTHTEPYQTIATEWDNKVRRSYENLLGFMAEFFGDPSLQPKDIDLVKTMKNPKPEFTFLYSSSTPIIPRFANCINSPMVDVSDGNLMCAAAFYANPELAARGVALPVNDMDRRDFPVPAIIDKATHQEHRYRDAQRWMMQHLH